MSDLIKLRTRLCLGSFVSSGLGVAAFFAIPAISPQQAVADSWGVSHGCSKPRSRAVQGDIDAFRVCIDEFVSQQQAAIKRHSIAASAAIDDWNNFVRED